MSDTVTINKEALRQIHAGQNGYFTHSGIATTSSNGGGQQLLPSKLGRVEHVSLTALGGNSGGVKLTINEAPADGMLSRPTNGAFTINISPSNTAGSLPFSFKLEGYSA